MPWGKLVFKCPGKLREDLWNFRKSSQGLRGHLITNFFLCNGHTKADKEILFALFGRYSFDHKRIEFSRFFLYWLVHLN